MILIRPLIGLRRGKECDAGIDEIVAQDASCPNGRRLAFVSRGDTPTIHLVDTEISEAMLADIKRLVSADASGGGAARVSIVPPPPLIEED